MVLLLESERRPRTPVPWVKKVSRSSHSNQSRNASLIFSCRWIDLYVPPQCTLGRGDCQHVNDEIWTLSQSASSGTDISRHLNCTSQNLPPPSQAPCPSLPSNPIYEVVSFESSPPNARSNASKTVLCPQSPQYNAWLSLALHYHLHPIACSRHHLSNLSRRSQLLA